MSKSTNVPHTFFALAVTVSKIYKLQIFDLQTVGQGHGLKTFATTPFDGKYQYLKIDIKKIFELQKVGQSL